LYGLNLINIGVFELEKMNLAEMQEASLTSLCI